jgi:hypothetical protein
MRRDPSQNAHVLEPEAEGGGWEPVDPQPTLMIPVIDESDPHANQRDSSSVTYGILYVARDDNVKDKDGFWFHPPGSQRFWWGVVGGGRWNQDHALTRVNFGVKSFRIRKGG